MHESNTTRERENLRRTERRSDKSNGDEDMANLSAIFRESAKYLRERERDPRSARLSSFEVMLIKLGYIIQQMRKGGGKHARIYTQRSFGSHRENSIYSCFHGFSAFDRSWRIDFPSKFLSNRNNWRRGILVLFFLRDVKKLNWWTANNYRFSPRIIGLILFAMYSINFRFNSFHFLELDTW